MIGIYKYSKILLDKEPFFTLKKTTYSKFSSFKNEDEKLKYLSEIIIFNLRCVLENLNHCKSHGIKHYSLPFDIFPLIYDKRAKINLEILPNYNKIINLLYEIGNKSAVLNISLSVYLGKNVYLAHEEESVCLNSVSILNFWGWVFNALGLAQDHSSPIIINPNINKIESIEESLNKFFNFFISCDSSARNRVVIQNEKKGFWNCKNVNEYFINHLKFKYSFSFPISYNYFFDCINPSFDNNNKIIDIKKWFVKFYSSWNCVPIFYWSHSYRKNSESLCKTIKKNPKDFGSEVVWILDCKEKDKGFKHLLKQSWNSINQELSY
jgi:UV DNA damage repair endonuclease